MPSQANSFADSFKTTYESKRPEVADRWLVDYEIPPILEGGFKLHDDQMDAWNANAFIVAICAGWQSGKTVLLSFWLRREIQRKGPGDYGAFSSTYKLLERKFLPELKITFADLAIWKEGKQRFEFTERGCQMMWGSKWNGKPTIIQLGHAEDPNSLESATLKAVAWDEPGMRLVPEQSFLTVESRLMVNKGRMCLASRPYDFGWYERLVKGLAPSLNARTKVIEFPSWNCPANPPEDDEYFDGLRERLPEWKFDMLYGGKFTRPAGAIYDCFDRKKDCVKRFKIPRHWQIYEGVDFGNPNIAHVCGALDPESEILYIFKATSGSGQAARGHAADWTKAMPGFFKAPEGLFGRKARLKLTEPIRYGGSWSENNWRTEFNEAEYPISKPGYSEVMPGIDRVYALIKTRRIKFFDDLSFLLTELDTYSFETDGEGEPIPGKIQDKAKFHRNDALRYLVAGVPWDNSEPTIKRREDKQTPKFTPKQDRDEDDEPDGTEVKPNFQRPERRVIRAR